MLSREPFEQSSKFEAVPDALWLALVKHFATVITPLCDGAFPQAAAKLITTSNLQLTHWHEKRQDEMDVLLGHAVLQISRVDDTVFERAARAVVRGQLCAHLIATLRPDIESAAATADHDQGVLLTRMRDLTLLYDLSSPGRAPPIGELQEQIGRMLVGERKQPSGTAQPMEFTTAETKFLSSLCHQMFMHLSTIMVQTSNTSRAGLVSILRSNLQLPPAFLLHTTTNILDSRRHMSANVTKYFDEALKKSMPRGNRDEVSTALVVFMEDVIEDILVHVEQQWKCAPVQSSRRILSMPLLLQAINAPAPKAVLTAIR